MAKQTTKKILGKFTWRRLVCLAVVAVAVVLLAAQVCLDVRFWRVARYPSGEPITSMIIQSVRGFLSPAVVEPVSKKVYLPSASLVLPPYSTEVPGLEYSYIPSFDGSDAEASVTVTNAVSVGISKLLNAEGVGQQQHNPSKLFDAVPELQACARGVHLVFGTKSTYDHLEFTKQLRDGRTMRVYSEKTKCSYPFTDLISYLQGAESY
ncbi:MAG TPA: hypothetical protein VLF40_04340 [Candidatus Saccharimonadales bacterium]|nr:hypothetical protein [Candidatus Saccharimonadales bacterium]